MEELGAEWVGHGASAIQPPMFVDYLTEHRIGLESNLTSNLQTRVMDRYPSHPLEKFLERGILATINTDDPSISAINLSY
ncbi:MAG: hypothetical protein DRI65_01465 [Chloroflexota bacterium]|nr:MAG: hypothetical protein DRI65_01465 [Chloroflexota bacterium]